MTALPLPDPNTPAIPDLTREHPIDVAGNPEKGGMIVVQPDGDVGVVPTQGGE